MSTCNVFAELRIDVRKPGQVPRALNHNGTILYSIPRSFVKLQNVRMAQETNQLFYRVSRVAALLDISRSKA